MEGGSRHQAPEPAVSIIVPVYREAENIPILARRIAAVMSEAGIEWELLLVDDDSGDGSVAAVEDLARHLPVRIEVRRTPPRDLSLSVLAGIQLSKHDRLVVMDADLSHAPEHIPDLLAALHSGCDMAVGSRYAAGGLVDPGWSPWRVLNSRIASLLARPLVRCADPMSGFFAASRSRLPDAGACRPIGYKIALELMVRGGLSVTEVPIRFRDRSLGASKLTARQQLNYLRHLGRLYWHAFHARWRAMAGRGSAGHEDRVPTGKAVFEGRTGCASGGPASGRNCDGCE